MKWLCDVNTGMNRTGVEADLVPSFVRRGAALENVDFLGLHCYDGQNHQPSRDERDAAVDQFNASVSSVIAGIEKQGIDVAYVISGGSPTFPCHALKSGQFLSPGTVFVWDWGYMTAFDDLPFVPGGVILTRVVSHPCEGRFTLDTGSKAISTDQPVKGYLIGANGAVPVMQSEEHWVWRMPEEREGERPPIGKVMYVIPFHICPTTALYDHAAVARGGKVCDIWKIDARHRL